MSFGDFSIQGNTAGTANATARILIADDSSLVRQQLRAVLELTPDWEVCGEAADGREAVEKARQLRPDAVILDFSMPMMNGLQAAQEISREFPEMPLLLFSMFLSRQLVDEARKQGFRGAVAKADVAHGLRLAIEALLDSKESFPATF
jgi:DNA-binding NarL/FixJ family response regulator